MATVKLGVFDEDQEMGTQVAVKIINKDKLVNERDKTSMAREITIMKLLHHPNILRLHALLESEEKM
jgi:5'-AMP-activated protein kinase catalytic alpha subunit